MWRQKCEVIRRGDGDRTEEGLDVKSRRSTLNPDNLE